MSNHKLITSKNYLFIKIRCHASDYMLKDPDWQKNKRAREAHQKACQNYLKFFESVVERFSGHTAEYIRDEYMLAFTEVAQEILHEQTGLKICCAGGDYIWCIPKCELGQQIFEWILENCKNKHKVLKKTRGTYADYGPTTLSRDRYRTSDKIKAMIAENALKSKELQ